MKNFFIGILIVGAVGGVVWWYAKQTQPMPLLVPVTTPQTKTYTNDAYHVSFSYPENYNLEEKNLGDAHRRYFEIILTEKTNTPHPVDGEGSMAITFDLYQNNLDRMTLLGWLKGTNQSNFKLSNGEFASTTVSGIEAVQYEWDGLYRADNVAFSYKDFIYSIAATHITEGDQIRKDFRGIISSLELK